MDVAMLSRSISSIIQWMNSLKPLNRVSGIDISQLETNLKEINEKVQKQISHSEWLQKVKDVVIDLNVLMEDLRYKDSTSGSTKSLIRSGFNTKNRSKATLQVKKATEELKRLIEEDAEEEVVINVKNATRNALYDMFQNITMFGREDEKKEIIDQLLNMNNSDVVPVIAIVGVPGMGKTKLARVVCEDEQVKFGFHSIWIDDIQETFDIESIEKCIITERLLYVPYYDFPIGPQPIMSETFDIESIEKCITEGPLYVPYYDLPIGPQPIMSETFDVEYGFFESISVSHHEKRILLVIDDLQIGIENDDLENLQKKLKEAVGCGCTDMAILVTTRSNHIANNIGARHVLKLQGINPRESRSLFNTVNEFTRPIEHDMVSDCGGVPFMIGMTATNPMLLMSYYSGYDRNLVKLQILRFIYYDDLSTCQKLCFAYCSLFPEDFMVDAERLIQLWTAEGFLLSTISSSNDNDTIIAEQQFGRACFNEFVPWFFYQAEEENNMNRNLYRMNGLMHKLARLVTVGDENINMDLMGERVHDGTLRVSFNFALDRSYKIPNSVFENAKKLRTMLFPYNTNKPRLPHDVNMIASTCDKIFNTFKNSLRVLDLHDLGIKMVPSSIEEVKYLRYLDLSHNNIEKLPSYITNLIHLQTLKLSQCHVLKELPKDLKDMSCLNHLDIEGCFSLTHMPSGINKLTSLQTLSLFVASKKQVSGGLRSITDLNNLRGHLEISHLEQVKFSPSKEAAKDQFLKYKVHLESVALRWDHKEDSDFKYKDTKLLEYLVPHPNLKVLFIEGYNGYTLSCRLASLQCLVKFTLNDCPNCLFLPTMDQLPHLKVLQLRRLSSLKFIAKNNQVGSSSSTPILFYPSLKELTISDCPNLKSWWENYILENNRPSFSCISKLNIQYCPQLACMPLYPGLDEELVLVESNIRSMRDTMFYSDSTETCNSQSQPPFSKLKYMVIERIKDSPPQSWLANFNSLEELHIRDCSNFRYLPEGFKCLTSLLSLTIERCEVLDLEIDIYSGFKNTPFDWKGLKNLTSLTLRSIPKLKSLPWGVETMRYLKEMRIYDCQALISIPDSINKLISLEKLVISECRNIDCLPKDLDQLWSLHTLIIMNCPLLLPRCQPDTGDDWPKMHRISNKLVKKTPQEGL